MKYIKKILLVLAIILSPVYAHASILNVNQGGTGVGNITGLIQGNGTAAFSSVTVGTALNLTAGTLALSNTTVTPGSYTNLTATIDAQGRITAASSGSGSSLLLQTNGINNGSQTLLNISGAHATVITDNGSGTITIDTPFPTPAGTNTMVQFNGTGVFTATANFTYDATASVFAVGFAGVTDLKLDQANKLYSIGNPSDTRIDIDDTAKQITLTASNGVLIPQLGSSGYVGIGAGGLLTAVSAPSPTLGLAQVGYGDVTTGALTSNNQFLYNTTNHAFFVAWGTDAALNFNGNNQQYCYGDLNGIGLGINSCLQKVSPTSWLYQVRDSFGGNWIDMQANTSGTASTIRFGVPATIGNGNAWSINDNANTFTLSSNNNRMTLVVPKTITPPATTGNQTINRMSGSVNFAATMGTLTVTDALVTTQSNVQCTVASNDPLMHTAQCVAGAGTIQMFPDNNPTNVTRVNFLVIN